MRLLARSVVARKVPKAVLDQLNHVLIIESPDLSHAQAVAERFKLSEYGVSLGALRSYANRLDRLVRPIAASHLVSSIVGCLSPEMHAQLVSGGQVLLLSRVMELLSRKDDTTTLLSTADLARLASILKGLTAKRVCESTKDKAAAGSSEPVTLDPLKLAESIRQVYGISLQAPPRDGSKSKGHAPGL